VSENKIGDILGNVMGGMAPMMMGMVKSLLSPEMIESMAKIVPSMLGAVAEAISSIDIRGIISSISIPSIVGAILPMAKAILDPLLDMVGPIIETILDMLDPVLQILYLLLDIMGPVTLLLAKPLGTVLAGVMKGIESLLGPVP
jgi:phage-related protein